MQNEDQPAAQTDSGMELSAAHAQAALLDLTHDTIMVRGLDGTITYWNRGAQETYGFTKEEAIGSKSHDLLRTEFPVPRSEIERLVDTTGRWEGELCHYNRNNEKVVVASRWALKPETRDNPACILEINNDISAQKKAEGELIAALKNRSEQRLSIVIEAAPSGMLMVDQEGKIILVNSQVEKQFGYLREELMGQPIEMLVPAASRPSHVGHRNEYLNEPQTRSMGAGRDLYGQRKDGSLIPVEIGLNPIIAEGERFVLASIIDISERKQSESEQAKLGAIVESSEDAIISKDLTGKVQSWNKAAESLFGYSAEEMIGQPVSILVPAASPDEEPNILSRISQGEKIQHYETVRIRKDGTEIPVSLTISPIRNPQGQITGASKIVRDISQRKQTEALLNQKLIELERSNEELEQFAYVCSHDLQEPLRVISNYTQLIAKRYKGQLDEKADQFIEFTVDASKRMQNLINDLLLFSRLKTKAQELREVDCADVMKAAIANLKLIIDETQATIQFDSLPKVMGDSSQLLQLFQNLLGNAVKFRSEDRPSIVVSACADGEFWLFSVRDNGIGIDMQFADRIFVIFQRLHVKEQYPGSGIGLAICKKIVQRHGGKLWVESQPGAGSTFHFTILKAQH